MERIMKIEEELKKERNKTRRYVLSLSLAEEYYNLYKVTKNTDFLDRALNIISNLEKKDVRVLNLLGLIYIEKGNLDSAISIFEEILSKYKISDDDKYIVLYNISLAYFRKGEISRAYAILKNIILNSKGEINMLSKKLLAKVCLKLGENNIKYIEEARSILENFEIPSEDLAITYAALAKYYNDRELLNKAKEVAILLKNERILADVLSVSDDENDLRKALEIYTKLGDYKNQLKVLYKLSAKDFTLFPEILERIKNMDDNKDKILILYDMYKRTRIYQFLKEAIKSAEKIGDFLFLARAYSELANYENEIINLRKSISYYEKYIQQLGK
ncbi:tetratricopeptide repeat protein [Saccharolobus caldissimus]|uniref:Tetratricopeptide repeat protein n=1 Tax=Saccharolobus caldissimus TaxID=1702097 RepID=A0AAQ4CNY0_9CREN|nr:tetratricopeptide repeat protein [Saccharolobus caldissimus]BDB97511.1 hypothetical protein SACC_05280 [Saccharolobus caldissimus]